MPQLNYSTRMADGVTLAELLDRERRHDEIVRHTSVGPHRDDLELTLDGMGDETHRLSGPVQDIHHSPASRPI